MRDPFTRLVLSQAVSRFGDGFFSIGVMWLIFTHTHSILVLGVLSGSYMLLMAVLTAVIAPLVDRLERRALTATVNVVSALIVLVPPALALVGMYHLWELYPAFFLVGAVSSPNGSAVSAMVPGLVGTDDLHAANARIQGTTEAMYLVGPAVGGVFLAYFGALSGLVVDGATFLVAAALLASLPRVARSAAASVERYWDSLRLGAQVLWQESRLRRLAALSILVAFTDAAFIVLSVPLVRVTLHGTTAGVGFLEGSLSAGFIVGAILVRRRTLQAWPWLRLGLVVLFCLSTAAIGLVPLLVWALGTQAVAGVAVAVFDVEWQAAFQLGVDDERLGRAFMWQRAAARVAGAVGAVVVALLAVALGVAAAFLVLGVVGAVLAVGILRRLNTPDPRVATIP
jgi:MFS family permease